MPTSDGSTKGAGAVALGLVPGLAVQELGWGDDVDDALREQVMDAIDADLLYEATEAVDVVLLWWRDSDGDVADGLVDALTDLSPTGYIWLLTPKVGRPGFIGPSSVAEGVTIAGLSLTKTANVGADWQATKVVRPKGARK